MIRGEVKVFFAMGGNFAAAIPDWQATRAALRNLDLTVHVSTKLNRSHLVHGRNALILPCLGRTEIDMQAGGTAVDHRGGLDVHGARLGRSQQAGFAASAERSGDHRCRGKGDAR
jgi:anaerobic selenocysteine-containing dehydrogenase